MPIETTFWNKNIELKTLDKIGFLILICFSLTGCLNIKSLEKSDTTESIKPSRTEKIESQEPTKYLGCFEYSNSDNCNQNENSLIKDFEKEYPELKQKIAKLDYEIVDIDRNENTQVYLVKINLNTDDIDTLKTNPVVFVALQKDIENGKVGITGLESKLEQEINNHFKNIQNNHDFYTYRPIELTLNSTTKTVDEKDYRIIFYTIAFEITPKNSHTTPALEGFADKESGLL